MSESANVVVALLMIIGMFGTITIAVDDRINWPALVGTVSLMIGSIWVLLWARFRHDKAPDFMRMVPGPLLERDGFCFKLVPNPIKQRCYLNLCFQSRFEGPCRAIVVIVPTKDVFAPRPGVGSLVVEIECPLAGHQEVTR